MCVHETTHININEGQIYKSDIIFSIQILECALKNSFFTLNFVFSFELIFFAYAWNTLWGEVCPAFQPDRTVEIRINWKFVNSAIVENSIVLNNVVNGHFKSSFDEFEL